MRQKWMIALAACLAVLCMLPGVATAAQDEIAIPLSGAAQGERTNALLAAARIDGVRLEYGDRFSFNDCVGARTEERGFVEGLNGRGVKVIGGGVARAAAALYLALIPRDDIEYTSIYTYNESFADDYVASGYDAVAVDWKNDLDFSFVSYSHEPLLIRMWEEEDALRCSVTNARPQGADEKMGSSAVPVGGGALAGNATLAASAVDGWTLKPGEVFSFNDAVGSCAAKAGYQTAENGWGVEVMGGGAAQVASGIYLAVKGMEDVVILEKQTYGGAFVGRYVEKEEDAVLVDYAGGVDFAFAWQGAENLRLSARVQDGTLICEVFAE